MKEYVDCSVKYICTTYYINLAHISTKTTTTTTTQQQQCEANVISLNTSDPPVNIKCLYVIISREWMSRYNKNGTPDAQTRSAHREEQLAWATKQIGSANLRSAHREKEANWPGLQSQHAPAISNQTVQHPSTQHAMHWSLTLAIKHMYSSRESRVS